LKIKIIYDGGLLSAEDFVPLRLIERNTAFSIRKAMTAIAIPISRRSIFRPKGPLGIVFVEALFIMDLLSIKGLRSATSNCLRLTQLILPMTGRNIHHRHCP
jgi:hypothetical protein